MSVSNVPVGQPIPLEAFLSGGETNKFPQTVVVDDAGSPVVGSPFSLTSVAAAAGLYRNRAFSPTSGYFTAKYTVYDDSGHTTPTAAYQPFTDQFQMVPAGGGSSFVGSQLTFTIQTNQFEFVLQSNNIEACL